MPSVNLSVNGLFSTENMKADLCYPGRADDFSQVDVHPVVAANQMTVVGFSILQLHQLKNQSSLKKKLVVRCVFFKVHKYFGQEEKRKTDFKNKTTKYIIAKINK